MSVRSLLGLAGLLAWFLAVGPALAVVSNEIAVTDATGEPIGGAEVTLFSEDESEAFGAGETDEEGGVLIDVPDDQGDKSLVAIIKLEDGSEIRQQLDPGDFTVGDDGIRRIKLETGLLAGLAGFGVNGQLGFSGGSFDNWPGGLGDASLAIPLGDAGFGFQADAAAGVAGSTPILGAGGQLFFRDPDQFMVGAAGSYFGYRGLDLLRAGLTAAWYEANFTLGADVGYQTGGVCDSFFGGVHGYLYPDPDLQIGVGGSGDGIIGVGNGSVEWQPELDDLGFGLSLFGDASLSTGGDYVAFAGVRLYFSDRQRSLRDRNRADLNSSVTRRHLAPAFFSFECEIDERDKEEDRLDAARAADAAAADAAAAAAAAADDGAGGAADGAGDGAGAGTGDAAFDEFLAALGLL